MVKQHLAVTLRERFYRSVNIVHDYERADALSGYVVSALARDLLIRVNASLYGGAASRTWAIAGPYGSGKSAFLSFLTALLGRGAAHEAAVDRVWTAWPKEAAKLGGLRPGAPRIVPVLIVGERAPIRDTLLKGLRDAALGFWDGRRGKTPPIVGELQEACAAVEAGEPVSDARCVELTTTLAAKISASTRDDKASGLLIVFDELGKLLEYAALHPTESDVYLLQALAEAASRSKAPVGIITVSHQDFASYAHRLPKSERDEWAKISGRYEPAPYLESAQHILQLLGSSLRQHPSAAALPSAKRHAQISEQLTIECELHVPLKATFPLHPLAAMLLGPLFRTGIGQNERSVFSFLNGEEPFGFGEWLKHADDHSLFGLDDLFDYAIHNTTARSTGARAWAATEIAQSRLGADAEAMDVTLLKAVALLTLAGGAFKLRADKATLALACDCTPNELQASLARVKRASAVVFRHFKGAYEIWDGSDLDVGALCDEKREKIETQGGLADRVQRALDPAPIIGSRHYIERGTFRLVHVHYVGDMQAAERVQVNPGDGALVVFLPDNLDRCDASAQGFSTQPGRALLVPHNGPILHDLALDLAATGLALAETPELESDPASRRVLLERQAEAGARLAAAHGEALRYGTWKTGDQRFHGTRPSSKASQLLDAAYPKAPRIFNELINRTRPSGSAASGRRVMLQHLVSDDVFAPDLGIEGHPPELSLYRSILQEKGLHRQLDDGAWRLTAPDANSDLAPAWAHISAQLEAALPKRITLAALMESLQVAPYGVRAGLAPILCVTWLLANRKAAFIYEDGTLQPDPDGALLERLLKNPKSIELQAASMAGQLAKFVSAAHRHLLPGKEMDPDTALIRVVKRLLRVMKKLSSYAKTTEHLSLEVRRVRAICLSTKDPTRLLIKDLPEALEIDPGTPDYEAFGQGLAEAIDTLRAVDDELLRGVRDTLMEQLAAKDPSIDGLEMLVKRAKVLNETNPSGSLGRFTAQTAELEVGEDESLRIWLHNVAMTILGKSPRQWTDQDAAEFEAKAIPIVDAFCATERLMFLKGKLQRQAGLRHVLFDFTDSEGQRRSQFGVLEESEAMTKLEAKAKQQVSAMLKAAKVEGVSERGVAYALIQAIAARLPKADLSGLDET